MITREQVRMARAALGWGVRELAKEAGIAANTVSRFENGACARPETLTAIQKVLEKAGVVLIPPDEKNGAGIRLKPGE